jgi:hypothetical protein
MIAPLAKFIGWCVLQAAAFLLPHRLHGDFVGSEYLRIFMQMIFFVYGIRKRTIA